MTPKEIYNENIAKRVISALEKRNMQGFFAKDKEEALKIALDFIPEKSKIAWGGSQSIFEIGLIEELYKGDFELFDRAKAKTQSEIDEVYRKAFISDFYFASANALTMDGKIINIDGNGNRVAAMIYGPKNVVLIVGINKIAKNEETGIERVKNYTAPINAIRLDQNTPCKITGSCAECTSDNTICCHTVTTRYSRHKNRIKVVIVGEQIGY